MRIREGASPILSLTVYYSGARAAVNLTLTRLLTPRYYGCVTLRGAEGSRLLQMTPTV